MISLDTEFERVTEWTPPQTSNPIQNYDGSNCGGDLREVFRRSCNIPFAQTALEVGIDGMIAGTQAWGIGQPIPIDLPRPAASTFGSTDNLDQQLPIVGDARASASRRIRWCRCTWRWSPRPSPTAAR